MKTLFITGIRIKVLMNPIVLAFRLQYSATMALQSLFGDTLCKNDGTEVQTSTLSTAKGGVIGIYFSAHWCPPCRGFTPKLATVYNDIKKAEKDFEIVFSSWDSDDSSFADYHKEMPWLAIPYDNDDVKDALREKYDVDGIPCLVFVEADTGNTITKNGREPVTSFGADGFPFTADRLAEAKLEIKKKAEAALSELADMKFLGKLSTADKPEEEVDLHKATKESEALAIAFMKGPGCQGSSLVLPKLLEARKKLGHSKLSVIVVPMMKEGEDFDENTKALMEGVPMIPKGERAQEVAKVLKPVLQDIDVPHVFMIDARDESLIKILSKNAARPIYFQTDAYPWSEEALKAEEERKEKLKEEMKAKIKDLQIFSENENCHILNKQGEGVSLATLQTTTAVGIYFSAHWCGPCRMFTPDLIKLYNELKEAGKSFEVIFISSDHSQEDFDNYYKDMPWCHLKFADRSYKDALSETFEVEGIPTLIILNGNGETLVDDNKSRSLPEMGADFFPWGPEDLERAEKEEEERKALKRAKAKEDEMKSYTQQEEAGKIVLRCHRGEGKDVKIGVDHVVDFGSFSTIAATSAVVTKGKKAWYEVTFKSGSGVSQVGWATTEFKVYEGYSGDGVGDDANSWGFDGQRVQKWHDGDTNWGKDVELDEDHVLGVAVDLESGKVLFGVDGDWGEPMGEAFDNVGENNVYPAITCSEMKIEVNFGDKDMKFGPPDESFQKLVDVVSK